MSDYIIPIGVNEAEILQGLAAIENGVVDIAQRSKEANASMQQSFGNTVQVAEHLGKTIVADTKTVAQLRDEAKQLGQSLGQALKSGADSGIIEKKLTKFSELMASLQARAKTGIKLEVDASKMAAFEQAIEGGTNDLEVLNQVIAYTKEQLATLDPNGEEFAELSAQLQTAEGFMEGLGISSQQTTEKTKSLKAQLREAKAALADMELAGLGNTEEFRKLSQEAGELEDQIGDVSQRVRVLASDTKYIDAGVQALQGLAGGFAAAQGAAALFGEENEEVNKVIQKVTGAMAVLQGIQALATALNKDSALSVLFLGKSQAAATVTTTALATATAGEAVATTGATAATNRFTAALLANPITAVLVAITAIVAALIAFANSSDDAKEATDQLNSSLEFQNELLDRNEKAIKRQTNLVVAMAKLQGKSELELAQLQKKSLDERLALQQQAYEKFLNDTYNNNELRRKADEETNKKIEEQNKKFNETIDDLFNEKLVSQLEYEKKVNDAAEETSKKNKQRAKEALELQKKNEAEQKAILDQRLKYSKELADSQTALIENQYEKERAALVNAAEEKVAALESEKSLSIENEKLKQRAIMAINNALSESLSEVNRKEQEDMAALQVKANEIIVGLMKEGAEKQLEQLKIDFEAKRKEVNEAYKNDEANRVSLIEKINQSEVAATKLAKDNIAREALQKEAERAELEVETASKFVGNLPFLEEQKQIAVMVVKLKYAELFRKQLIDQGNAENSTAVLTAQKGINELKKQIEDLTKDLNKKSGKGIFNLSELLFGDQGEEGNKAINDALRKMYDGIKQITDFIISQYQRQIDKKQEVIDQYNDSIDDLEEQLDKEKELRDQGLANNVATLEAEIQEKKRQRDEEIKQQEEIQKKQESIQRAQLILDTVTQASNLITAATEIFSALAGIPFVGVPLAIATIGVMIGGFVAAKAQAFSAVGNQKFGEGGTIDGPSHASGGQKYRSVDGKGGVIELEGGEKVTRKSQSVKYGEILDGINDGDFSSVSDDALRNFLSDLGISLESDQHLKAIEIARDRDNLRSIFISKESQTPEELVSIADDVAYLANQKRGERQRWEDDKYIYERFGNKTTKRQK